MTVTPTEQLLPCPFCSSSHVSDRHVRDGRQIFCINCGAAASPAFHGPNNDTMARAVAAWNRRAHPPSADAEGLRVRATTDGFTGTVVGEYRRLDGYTGKVVQMDGSIICHIYGDKWLEAVAEATQP